MAFDPDGSDLYRTVRPAGSAGHSRTCTDGPVSLEKNCANNTFERYGLASPRVFWRKLNTHLCSFLPVVWVRPSVSACVKTLVRLTVADVTETRRWLMGSVQRRRCLRLYWGAR